MSIVHQSNILGTINDVVLIGEHAARVKSLFVVDACQSIPHMPVDAPEPPGADLNARKWAQDARPNRDWRCLWGRSEVLAAMPPFISGGSMIRKVTMEGTTFADPPQRFEAGVPITFQAVGLAAAADHLTDLGMANVAAHEHALTGYALDGLESIPGVRIIGPRNNVERGGAISFVVDGIHAHDVGQVLDDRG